MSKSVFSFTIWEYWTLKKVQVLLSSNHKNKRLECYEQFKKNFDQQEHYNCNIWKIATSQGDDCKTESLLKCSYFEKYYNLIEIDLIK